MLRYASLVAISVLLAAGCATPGTENSAAKEEKEYITGSRIPVKDKVQPGTKSTSDRNTIDDMVRRGGGATGGVAGAGGG